MDSLSHTNEHKSLGKSLTSFWKEAKLILEWVKISPRNFKSDHLIEWTFLPIIIDSKNIHLIGKLQGLKWDILKSYPTFFQESLIFQEKWSYWSLTINFYLNDIPFKSLTWKIG